MKIDVKLTAAARAAVDFPTLRAALMAAQAATPTARAVREPSAGDALPAFELFGGDGVDIADGAARNHHRFTTHVPGLGDEA